MKIQKCLTLDKDLVIYFLKKSREKERSLSWIINETLKKAKEE